MGEVGERREAYEQARKESINNLAVKLLQGLNPQVDEQVIRKDILGRTDIFSDKPLPFVLMHNQTEDTSLKDYRQVLAISRFYWDNVAEVPKNVAFISEPPREPIEEDSRERTFVWVDQRGGSLTSESKYNFVDTNDVYLRQLYPGSISARGAENLLIGTNLEGKEIKLSSRRNIALLPGAVLNGSNEQTVNLRTDGDVLQYEGAHISPHKVDCKNYIQAGGTIMPPSPDRAIIDCEYGKFVAKGGDRPGTDYLTIRDKDSRDELVHEAQQKLAPDHLPQFESAPEPSPTEKFDKDFQMHGEEEVGADGIVVRAYYIDTTKSLDFAKKARLTGWDIGHALVMGDKVEYVITRTPQE